MGVGDYDDSSGASLPFSEQWNGSSWSVLAILGPEFSGLNSISCFRASDCMAVGFSRYGTLAESWDGTSWKILPSPAPRGSISSSLSSVSCPSADFCSAVGTYNDASSAYKTLAATWNGSRWVLAKSADAPGATGSLLNALSCASPVTCEAVGYSFNKNGNSHTLAESWTGTRWALVSSVDAHPGQENELAGISCASASDCIAVGDYFAMTGNTIPLVEHWSSSGWSMAKSPTTSGSLDSVSCPGVSTCLAVGSGPKGTFTEGMSGNYWRVIDSPDPRGVGRSSVLAGVSCSRPASCISVGFDTGSASDTTYDVTEFWNGRTWLLVKSPRP
jgi:hypothetical protein